MGTLPLGIGVVCLAAAWSATGGAAEPAPAPSVRPAPTVWMGPPAANDGKALRALFEHPEQWAETRSLVDYLLYTDLNFSKQFKDDDELRKWFGMLAEWKISLSLEVGAVKPWSHEGEKTFAIEKPMWERIERLGGKIAAIAMDEPLLCCRKHIQKSDEHALRETANYIAQVRRHFPDILIGDIETYPSIPLEDHFTWIEGLNARLAELGVRGLDFYRLDVNWAEMVVFNRGSWREVRKLELWCRERKIPFSLIYWASDYPAMKRRGMGDDSTWYVSILRQGYDYAMVDGAPDQYVIESWIGLPKQALPDTTGYTFTQSVRDFSRRFVR